MAARATVRHHGDLVRMGLAAALFALSVLAVQRDRLSLAERDVFRLVNDLPDAVYLPVWAVMQAGNLLAPVVAGILVVLLTRRVRLGASIATAGVATWLVAKVVKQFVERGRPAAFLDGVLHEPETLGLGFVSGHAAVAAAIATIAAPYLPRTPRRAVWGLAWVVGFGRVYTGAHLPLDIVGGVAVGWFVGSVVHAAFGAPHYTPSADRVTRFLASAGLPAVSVTPAAVAARASHPFRVTSLDGRRLFAKVLDPERRDSDWVYRVARTLLFREVRDEVALRSLREQVEHEAAVTLSARAAGVRVPEVVLAKASLTSAALVLADVPGENLADLPPMVVGDGLLREVWAQVRLLHAHRIAHRELVRSNVHVDGSGMPWLVDLGNAELGADDATLAGDVAELLASLAVAVGVERAVGTARSELGEQAVRDAVPSMEPFALSALTRGEARHLLPALRAAAAGDLPREPHAGRPSWRVVLGAAAVTFAGLPILGGWEDVWPRITGVGLRWLGVAAVLAVAAFVLQAGALLAATGRRLALGRTALAVVEATAAEATGGVAGRRRHLTRYLRAHGVRTSPGRNARALLLGAAAAGALALSLAASLTAAGAGAGVARPALVAFAVYGALRAIGAGSVPVVTEAALVAGLAVAGVPAAPAVAGVLVHRVVAFWLPVAVTVRR